MLFKFDAGCVMPRSRGHRFLENAPSLNVRVAGQNAAAIMQPKFQSQGPPPPPLSTFSFIMRE